MFMLVLLRLGLHFQMQWHSSGLIRLVLSYHYGTIVQTSELLEVSTFSPPMYVLELPHAP